MAEEGGGGGDVNPVVLLGALIIGVFILWVAGGGPERYEEQQMRELPEANISEDGSYFQYQRTLRGANEEVERTREQLEEAKLWGVVSPYKGQVTFDNNISGPKATDERSEYLRIRVTGTEARDISGWKVESVVTGVSQTIGAGIELPMTGRTNIEEAIVLEPGDRALIGSGPSPIGASFKTNMCSGYLAQHQEFSPLISRSCPYPQEELERSSVWVGDDTCYDYVRSLSRCEAVTEDLTNQTPELSNECIDFVERTLTYNGCVNAHAIDEEFFENSEWRIYLEASDELWRTEREAIRLIDETGKTVDVLTY